MMPRMGDSQTGQCPRWQLHDFFCFRLHLRFGGEKIITAIAMKYFPNLQLGKYEISGYARYEICLTAYEILPTIRTAGNMVE